MVGYILNDVVYDLMMKKINIDKIVKTNP